MNDEELQARLNKIFSKADDLKKQNDLGDDKAVFRILGDIEHEAVSAMYRLNTLINWVMPWKGRP